MQKQRQMMLLSQYICGLKYSLPRKDVYEKVIGLCFGQITSCFSEEVHEIYKRGISYV